MVQKQLNRCSNDEILWMGHVWYYLRVTFCVKWQLAHPNEEQDSDEDALKWKIEDEEFSPFQASIYRAGFECAKRTFERYGFRILHNELFPTRPLLRLALLARCPKDDEIGE